jgi:hypothetical protein
MSNIRYASVPIRQVSNFTSRTLLQHVPQCTNLRELTLHVYTNPDWGIGNFDNEIPKLSLSSSIRLVEMKWSLGWDEEHRKRRWWLYHNMVKWAHGLCSESEKVGFEDNEVANSEDWEGTWIMRRGRA